MPAAPVKARRFLATILYNRGGRVQEANSTSVHTTEKEAQEKVQRTLAEYGSRATNYVGAVYELKGVLRFKPVPIEYVTAESQ